MKAKGFLEQRLADITKSSGGQVQRAVAGLRHRRTHHRADGRREDRHRLHGRLPTADQRLQDAGQRTRQDRARLRHRLQPDRRAQHGRRPARLRRPQRHRPQGPEGLRQRRLRRATAPWSARSTTPASTPPPASRCSTSSRRSARPRWNPVRRRHSRSSSPGPACWSSRTRPSCSTTAPRGTIRPSTASSSAATTPASIPRCSTRSCRPSSTPPSSSTSNPLEAAKIVADGSGLPQEVVYLYNGPGGTSFDTTLKPSLVEALKGDVPYLKSIGDFADLDVDGFAPTTPPAQGVRRPRPELRHRAEGRRPTRRRSAGRTPSATSRSRIPSWPANSGSTARTTTQPAANPGCLLRAVREATAKGAEGARRLRSRRRVRHPVVRRQGRLGARRRRRTCRSTPPPAPQRYTGAHPGAAVVDYQQALAGAV